MKLNSLLSYTLLYSIVWDNRKLLLCNKKMAMDGYKINDQPIILNVCVPSYVILFTNMRFITLWTQMISFARTHISAITLFENFVYYLRSGNTDKLNIIPFQINQQHKINLSTQLIFDRILTKTVVQLNESGSFKQNDQVIFFHFVLNGQNTTFDSRYAWNEQSANI
ncbi:Hypothetical_protein [Hexamita inflata]|uniref:Hypothetical_protein n=1 Tax=Hexamita inflata TaxID=28002 RepID=A0AA86U8S2_9EUKA|nr:Hypothetical protein HINF_LOCUS35460 [Hexamita inflata]